jgi:hypothetical protein
MAMTDDERDDAAELASWLPSRKLRARVAELEAERDAALATLERVRARVADQCCYCGYRDLEAALGELGSRAEPAPRTNLERVRGLIAAWRATDPCDPRGAKLALRDAADELEDAFTPR